MLLIGAGKVVGAGEVLLGAHIEVVVADGIEHGIDATDGGNLDGAWGQPRVLIGVVGRVRLEQLLPDALQGKLLQGKLDGGVGLQRHVALQAVQVHAGNHGLLLVVGRLLVDDAGQGTHLHRRQLQRCGLGLAVALPEMFVLLHHALHETLDAHVPIDVVRVGYEERGHGTRVVAVAPAGLVAVEHGGNGGRVDHQLAAQYAGQPVHGAHLGNGEVHAGLLAVLQFAEHGDGSFARFNGVAARADVVAVAAVTQQCRQAGHPGRTAHGTQAHEYRVLRIVVVDIQILRSVRARNGRQDIESRQAENQCQTGSSHI